MPPYFKNQKSLRRVVREFHPKADNLEFFPVVYVKLFLPRVSLFQLRFITLYQVSSLCPRTRITDPLSGLNVFLIISSKRYLTLSFGELTLVVVEKLIHN